MWRVLYYFSLFSIISISASSDQSVFSNNSFVSCEENQQTRIIKEPDVYIGISNHPANNSKCSLLFRSPFKCPHQYSIQVIEENPGKCLQNSQTCELHQKVYWTRSGVLKMEINLVESAMATRFKVHVVRIDCDNRRKSKLHMISSNSSLSPPPTGKLKLNIHGESGLLNMEEESKDTPMVNVKTNPDTSSQDKFLLIPPQTMTNHLLTSPAFPRNPIGPSDCFFVIRPGTKSCRLRIHFHFFNLPDPDERSCLHHFLLIDNRRICGCRSGLVYLTQLDNRPKIVRYVSRGQFDSRNSIGFLLEVQEEGCPYRYQSTQPFPVIKEVEPVTSGFYRGGQYQQCNFHFRDWLKVLQNPLWSGDGRQQCRHRVQYWWRGRRWE